MNNHAKGFRWLVCLFASSVMNAWSQCSPILIDLGKDGINLGDAGVGVYFDVNADTVPDHVQWVRPHGNEVFLVADRNGNGIVDNGGELFGHGTPLFFDGGFAPNGFVGLAQYDLPELGGNDDGLITSADQIWSGLSLWKDENADGISTSAEMLSLSDASITSLETIPKRRKYRDTAGNVIPWWAWANSSAVPKKTLMVDVYFLVLEEQSSLCRKPFSLLTDSSQVHQG